MINKNSSFRKFKQNTPINATQLFGISYNTLEGQHILCSGMYEYQVDWLINKLSKSEPDDVPTRKDIL